MDIASITESQSCGGVKLIVVVKDAGSKLEGYYTMTKMEDAWKGVVEFIEEHKPHLVDRRAFIEGKLVIKPDGDRGAFGPIFKEKLQLQGYILDASAPNQPNENNSEAAIGRMKRKATTLIEAKSIPAKYFPLVLKYIAQLKNVMPSTGNSNSMSAYEMVTGLRISRKNSTDMA